ncbi:MAG: hypothetical protein JO132_01635 [Streptosporangiaceae bacterium]|nr:hypothetical protein [Streptosporangiaceae bacterium]
MPDEPPRRPPRPPTSQDLEDYEVMEPSDSLSNEPPGTDPLDRGVATPERWSAGMRFGTTDAEQRQGESLDQHLAEEEPDTALDGVDKEQAELDAELPPGLAGEDPGDEDVDGLLLDDPEPRAGRLVAEDEGAHPAEEADLVAHDAGISGGAATAEEAAVHVVPDDDYDIRSGDQDGEDGEAWDEYEEYERYEAGEDEGDD